MNITADTGATYRLLATALEAKGYHVTTSTEGGRLVATYTSPRGTVWKTQAARIRYPFTSTTAHTLSVDKEAAYAAAQAAGIPVPATDLIATKDTFDETKAMEMIASHAPLVVKPNDSSLSRGLTLNVRTKEQLLDAVVSARQVKQSDVLVQRQVEGEEIRFVIIKGKVVAAMLRRTPRVVGDGRHSVRELITIENQLRQSLKFPYITYPQLTPDNIDESFFTDETILAKGELLELSRATMIKNGCSVFEILDAVHDTYIKAVERLVSTIDTDFLVADFIVEDFSKPASMYNYSFLEFNVSPVLKLCYGCRDGKMFDIVPLVAQLIDDTLA
jgi:cyanophycin synthetase